MKRAARTGAMAAAALLLAACSATKLAYNNLDFLVSWEVGKFVDLEGPSEEIFDAGLDSVWQWHRRSQLTLYVNDLRELAQAVAQPVSAEQVEAYYRRAQAHADRLVAQALPPSAKVLAALDDRQVAGLLKRMADDQAERAEDRAERSNEEARQDAIDRAQKSLKRWLGSVTGEQKQRVAAWAAERRIEAPVETAVGQEWREAFAALMQERAGPEFEARLSRLVQDPELASRAAYEQIEQDNLRAGIRMLSDLSQGLSPRQREHLQRELEELARDLEQLAAEAAQ